MTAFEMPLSAAQEGIWTGQLLDEASPAYNAAEYVHIRGAVDPDALRAAIRTTVTEAEALRAHVLDTGPWPEQVVEACAVPVPLLDMTAEPDPEETCAAWMRADLVTPVDPRVGPLFAQAVLRRGVDEWLWYQRIHHIAADGYAFSLLRRRVAEVYTSLVHTGDERGRPFPPLRPVLDEDREYRSGGRVERDREFWLARHAARPDPVSLAAPAPASRGFLRRSTRLDLGAALGAAATSVGVGEPELLVAAVAAYMHAETGAGEVVLGLPVTGRLGTAAMRVPCMAMNIVPLRVPVSPDATPAGLAGEVAAEMRATRGHQRYRYEWLRRDLGLLGPGRRLFGPVVNIVPFDSVPDFAGVPGTPVNLAAGPVEDLAIALRQGSGASDHGGMTLEVDANPAAYSEADVAAHTDGLVDLLDRLVARPETPVTGMPAVAGGTGHGAADAVLDGGPLPEEPGPVLDRIADRCREVPDAVAVEHGSRRVTYGELTEAVDVLADGLRGRGAAPGGLVAVRMPRGVDAVVAVLAVLRTGAAYLPLDPADSSARTDDILADADPDLIVTPGSGGVPAVAVVGRGTADLPCDDAAYVIHTSGSTGRPAGVVVGRDAFARFVTAAGTAYGPACDDRVLQFAPLHFDAAVEEIFLTLCAGATLVLRDEEMVQSVPKLLAACDEARITVLDLPTALWHEVVHSLWTGVAELPSTLHSVIIGGEAALPDAVDRWRERVGDRVRLVNTYGPTEATVVATAATLTGPEAVGDPSGAAVPIGSPLPGVRATVCTPEGRPAGRGVTGELYLLGDTLAAGYLNRPDRESAGFVTAGFLPGAPRAYRTGDLVVLRPDGLLEHRGRVDNELKVSGHRINPAEIEAVLVGDHRVTEAAVVGRSAGGATTTLHAYVSRVPHFPDRSTERELWARLRATLPAPLVPTSITLLDRMPRTSTGKIDRGALRDLTASHDAVPAAEDPVGEPEATALRIWREVLDAPGLTVDSDFFAAGGQSLQAIQAAGRLAGELGADIPATTIFQHGTVARLVGALRSGSETEPTAELSAEVLADTVLDPAVVPTLAAAEVTPPPAPAERTVLLAGITGFVGAHLLARFVATGARVLCPVAAGDHDEAAATVRKALADHEVTVGDPDRVVAFPADVAAPRLGLGDTEFAELAATCDLVCHNAAAPSPLRGYTALRQVNTYGTRELLRLAAAVRPVPLHCVSTLALAPPARVSTDVVEDFVAPHAGLSDGYTRSRWVVERLVQQAGERGLPVVVHRPGRVFGAAGSGVIHTEDLVWGIVRAGITVGALPYLDLTEVWTPADHLARCVAALSGMSSPVSTVFHHAPGLVRFEQMIGWVREYGYAVDTWPVRDWRERCAAGDIGGGSAVAHAAGLLAAREPPPRVRTDNTRQSPAGRDMPPVTIDRELIHRHLDHGVATGWLPKP